MTLHSCDYFIFHASPYLDCGIIHASHLYNITAFSPTSSLKKRKCINNHIDHKHNND